MHEANELVEALAELNHQMLAASCFEDELRYRLCEAYLVILTMPDFDEGGDPIQFDGTMFDA